ncbi:MAG: enoyl-CoA hydratase/isomerase family protein [bacterium]
METIEIVIKDAAAQIYLNRPKIHNAFNEVMLGELIKVFQDLYKRKGEIRVVILTGRGKSFCAGADLNWMKKMIDFSYEENLKDSYQVSKCMYLLYSLPMPTIARVNGAAIGGGMGLVGASDIVIAQEEAVFSLSEVKLGLVPACISPYVVKRAGESKCREFFLSGERITASKALSAGLINEIVPLSKLDEAVQRWKERFMKNGPEALSVCKDLLEKVPGMSLDKAKKYTAEVISKLRISKEGQEGMKAFLEKRRPDWRIDV